MLLLAKVVVLSVLQDAIRSPNGVVATDVLRDNITPVLGTVHAHCVLQGKLLVLAREKSGVHIVPPVA
jgi:hypothetical protein